MIISSRRRFLFGGAAALIAAPAIVRVAANLMPMSARYSGREWIEKLARPPMLFSPMLKNEPASIMPGLITYVSNRAEEFRPAFEILGPYWRLP